MTATTATRAEQRPVRGAGLGAALRTEYRKLVTTRMWWVLLAIMVAYMATMAAFLGLAMTLDPASGGMGAIDPDDPTQMVPLSPRDMALTTYTLALSLGYVFPVIVGAMSITGEFRHMTITPTFLTEPRRTLVLAAKVVSAVPIGLLFGLAGTGSTVAGGAALLALRGEDPMLGDPEVQRALVWSVAALTVWALVGVGFGAMVRHQVAAIVSLLAFTQLVEPTLRFALAFVEPLHGVAKWLPGAAGDAMAGSSLYATIGGTDLLTRWQGLAVLAGYGLVFAVIGRLVTLRRDIT